MGVTAAATVQRNEWTVPTAMLGPLLYWICVASILGYYLLTWATSVLPASQVASFQALQPLMGTVLSFLFLGERPTAWDLGGIGVISGLVLVTHDARDSQKQREVSLTHIPTRSKAHHQRHI
jgi:drug/metabolite transporter (DMT)-like permease